MVIQSHELDDIFKTYQAKINGYQQMARFVSKITLHELIFLAK
jgi:hypothetical protein